MFQRDGLKFRLPEGRDTPAFYRMRNDEQAVGSLGGFSLGMTYEAAQQWIAARGKPGTDIVFSIEPLESDEMIGHVGLYKIDHRIGSAEFAILIGNRAFWGKGFGKAATLFALEFAFGQLNLNRVSLQVLETNTRAVSLYQAVGFRQEGVLREAQFKYGHYIDVVEMAILRREFLSGTGTTSGVLREAPGAADGR